MTALITSGIAAAAVVIAGVAGRLVLHARGQRRRPRKARSRAAGQHARP